MYPWQGTRLVFNKSLSSADLSVQETNIGECSMSGKSMSWPVVRPRLNRRMRSRYEDKIQTDLMITQAAPCCIYDVRQLKSSYRDTLNPVLEEGEQRTGHGAIAICNKGWKSYPTICNATVVMQLTVDYLNRKAVCGYGAIWLLNIRHGNGASVVVRAGESPVHGEGKQLLFV